MTTDETMALAEAILGTYGDDARAIAYCVCAIAAEGDTADALEAKAYDEQAALIEAACDKHAADNANYGWGVAGGDNRVSLATKVYGVGILQSEVDYETGTIEHEWIEGGPDE